VAGDVMLTQKIAPENYEYSALAMASLFAPRCPAGPPFEFCVNKGRA
jgi:hypothetical protein